MNSLLPLLICSVAATPLLGGCVRDRVVYVHDQPQPQPQYQPAPAPPPVQSEVVVTEAPPPVQEEVIVGVAPGPDYLWVGGCWEWHGRWIWAPGHWGRRPFGGARWYGGRYRYDHGRHIWVGGHWGR